MIVLFDGVCNLCSKSVQFILPRDERGRVRFAPLQSKYAESLMDQYGVARTEPPTSIVLIDDGQAFTESDAAIRILGALRFPWNLAMGFLVVPKWIRNRIYRHVASHRYDWFGRTDQCWLPSPDWQRRFIDLSDESPRKTP